MQTKILVLSKKTGLHLFFPSIHKANMNLVNNRILHWKRVLLISILQNKRIQRWDIPKESCGNYTFFKSLTLNPHLKENIHKNNSMEGKEHLGLDCI
ncbi:Uncharacterized protein TCM_015853 [Theobroma cacao]|uniref:Uncharacterized protein n=1 Tax=Theobroma cacao TaxID=3641 RepID=A0A061G4V7_THECC|nr:Uncharacterized protein TCM_015853 [Theobroma cacao]